MLVEERRRKLSEVVRERGYVPLPDLVHELGVSESTVRRDLEVLHDAGLIRRTHGGAMAGGRSNSNQPLPGLDEREAQQTNEKRSIGAAMASLIQDGETVLLDGGTTTLEVARCLQGRAIQVVTTSLPIANLFASSWETDLVLLGGHVYPKTGVAVGPITQQALGELRVQRLVMSVGGISERGLFNDNLLLVETERAMMRCAAETTVVADHTKFGRQALAFLADWSKVHRVVVDAGIRPEQRAVVGTGVELLVAGERTEPQAEPA